MRELQAEGYAYTSGRTTLVADRGQAQVTLRVPVTGTRYKGDVMPPPGGHRDAESLPIGELVTAVGEVSPPEYVTRVLGLEPDDLTLRIEAVAHQQSAPVRLTVRWYSQRFAGLPGVPAGPGHTAVGGWPAMRYEFEQATGRTLNAGLDSFHGRTADEREARLLRIAVGTSVLARVTTWADRDGVAEYIEAVYPPGVVVSMEYLDSLASLDDEE